ncbi:hypothetical protein PENSPDRAFT_359996 [Peniophora sp. CONT]|nr:hypothetical protein PENSPDRAFT_359996 [Peniophora sp. CONT]
MQVARVALLPFASSGHPAAPLAHPCQLASNSRLTRSDLAMTIWPPSARYPSSFCEPNHYSCWPRLSYIRKLALQPVLSQLPYTPST